MNQSPETSWFRVETPLVPLAVRVTNAAVREIHFNTHVDRQPGGYLEERVATELIEYASGRRKAFTVPLAPKGTEFERKIWAALLTIPFGETRSYGGIARSIGNPRAARAVGLANHRNPIPIIIPCHRVIGSDGSLCGFGGGLALKRRLLELEGAITTQFV